MKKSETDTLEMIESMDISNWLQTFHNSYNNTFKNEFSEVFTPFNIAQEMLECIPEQILSTFDLKWLDAGCGSGNISLVLYNLLYKRLKSRYTRREILNMIHLLDINKNRLDNLRDIFPCENIYHTDFLNYSSKISFDVVVSNPPFIIEKDGKKQTIWKSFFKKCIECLKPGGILCIILPSIWMKPEHDMFHYITSFNIYKIKCLNNNEANKLFGGDARTPMSYMVLQNMCGDKKINMYDNSLGRYISFELSHRPIPMYFPYMIKKLEYFVEKYGSLRDKIVKTNSPSKSLDFVETKDDTHTITNIKTCKLNNDGPYFLYNYSDKACKFHGKRKVILSNKMYGIPYYDREGSYGISTRDNYLYIDKDNVKCERLFQYLNCNVIYFIYETTRYRMSYLEKYAFEFIPNIFTIPLDKITNESIQNFFGLTDTDADIINRFISSKRIKCFKIDSY